MLNATVCEPSTESVECEDKIVLSQASGTHLEFNASGEVKQASRDSFGRLKRDRRDHCLYCEKNVTNFPRHLILNHEKEVDVARISPLPKNSKTRPHPVNDIRRRGW